MKVKNKNYWLALSLSSLLLANTTILALADEALVRAPQAETDVQEPSRSTREPLIAENSSQLMSKTVAEEQTIPTTLTLADSRPTQEPTTSQASSRAAFFTVDDFCYIVTNASNAEVTITNLSASGQDKPALSIPNQVEYEGQTYLVTAVGDMAFKDCVNLETIDFSPASALTRIGAYAFEGCQRLANAGLAGNHSVQTIGAGAFYQCQALTESGLGSNTSVVTIENYAFKGCSGLLTTGLATNTSVQQIGAYAFEGCVALPTTGLATNNTVVSLGAGAFYECLSLTDTGLAGNATLVTLGDYAFKGCAQLTDTGLATNQGLQMVGNYAFEKCQALVTTGLAENQSITTLGTGAFYECMALTATGLATNTIVTTIGDHAFKKCTALTDLGLTDNTTVQTIGNYAFEDCINLTGDLVLTASVAMIGAGAFQNTNHEQVYWLTQATAAEVLNLESNAFNFSPSTADQPILYIPDACAYDPLGDHSLISENLVKMSAPATEAETITRLSDQTAQLTFTPSANGQYSIQMDGTEIATETGEQGIPQTVTLTELSPFEAELTITAQTTFPQTTDVKAYNTVVGEEKPVAVPMYEYELEKTFEVFTGANHVSAKVSAPLELFSQLVIAGEVVAPTDYELTTGSTVITLKEAYLKTLANDTYPAEIILATGQIFALNLTINVPEKATDDTGTTSTNTSDEATPTAPPASTTKNTVTTAKGTTNNQSTTIKRTQQTLPKTGTIEQPRLRNAGLVMLLGLLLFVVGARFTNRFGKAK